MWCCARCPRHRPLYPRGVLKPISDACRDAHRWLSLTSASACAGSTSAGLGACQRVRRLLARHSLALEERMGGRCFARGPRRAREEGRHSAWKPRVGCVWAAGCVGR
eukprot:30994-Rhodomonas_salina.1